MDTLQRTRTERINPFERAVPAARRSLFCAPRAVSVSEIRGKGGESEAFLEISVNDRFFYVSGVGGMQRVSVKKRGDEVSTEIFADRAYAEYL